jgi:hypothetical protein
VAYTRNTVSAGIDEKKLTCPKQEMLLTSFIDVIYEYKPESIVISIFVSGMQ